MPSESYCFTSTLFQIEAGEDEETNPFRYGKQLATYLGKKVADAGYDNVEVLPEDWGWCVVCSREPVYLWIGCGNRENVEILENPKLYEEQPVVWECFAVAEVGFFKRIFGKVDGGAIEERLHKELGEILFKESEIEMVDCEDA